MKDKLISAEAFKKYCRNGFKSTAPLIRGRALRQFANQLKEDICKDIDEQPPVYAIPIDWIRQQADQYPGMESAMWNKLLRLWEKEKTKREIDGGDR